jgi:hypothetical protein
MMLLSGKKRTTAPASKVQSSFLSHEGLQSTFLGLYPSCFSWVTVCVIYSDEPSAVCTVRAGATRMVSSRLTHVEHLLSFDYLVSAMYAYRPPLTLIIPLDMLFSSRHTATSSVFRKFVRASKGHTTKIAASIKGKGSRHDSRA